MTEHHRARRTPVALAIVLVALLAAGCTGTAELRATTTGTIAPTTKEVLGQYPSPNAPGYTQYLLRVTIQPGVKLATHHHPGTQVSRITAGELHYTLVSGSAKVGRKGAEQPTEDVQAPVEIILQAGDTVYEVESLVHYGENKGTVPVVVEMNALLKSDEPTTINES